MKVQKFENDRSFREVYTEPSEVVEFLEYNINYLIDKWKRKSEKLEEENQLLRDNEYVKKHELFSILDEVNLWRKTRNDLMHDLAEDECSIDEIRKFAVQGDILVSKLNNKSRLINDHNDNLKQSCFVIQICYNVGTLFFEGDFYGTDGCR